MRRLSSVFFVLLSMLVLAGPLSAQTGGTSSSGEPTSGFGLEQNYPNPFNPDTNIPFYLGEDLFVDGPVTVSIRIYNLLPQEIATPVPKSHPSGEVPFVNLEFTSPGAYEAYWDGKDRNGRQVASGIYFVRLTVNGQSVVMKMFVTK